MTIDDYKNFIALLFDYQTQVFIDKDGMTIDYQYNKMTIKNDSINVELKDNTQKINLEQQMLIRKLFWVIIGLHG